MSRHIDSIWSLRTLRLPAGRSVLDHFPLYVPIQGCTKSRRATYLPYMNDAGHPGGGKNALLRAEKTHFSGSSKICSIPKGKFTSEFIEELVGFSGEFWSFFEVSGSIPISLESCSELVSVI